jgi:uncharacterized membrane protein YfcA
MALELYQAVLLVLIGALVGVSMSFMGQTGQGVVIPLVFLITGNILLAIAISVLNDLITASAVSIGYVRKKQVLIRRDTFILLAVGMFASALGIFILMTTPLGSIFGWALPAFIILFGLVILKQGFPTSDTLKRMVLKLAKKVLAKRGDADGLARLEAQFQESRIDSTPTEKEEINGIITPGSRLFFLLAIGLGLYVGVNSGMFGANSGMILALVLVMLYGYPLKKGVGTALVLGIGLCACTFVLYQLMGYAFKGAIFWDPAITVLLAAGSVVSGLVTSTFVQKLPAKTMGRCMAVVMLVLGTVSLIFYIS